MAYAIMALVFVIGNGVESLVLIRLVKTAAVPMVPLFIYLFMIY